MPDAARRPALPVAAVGLAALSLLLPWAIAFDAWSWIVWGRETARLGLDTAGGPSWKPLPVVFTTVYSLAGDAAPLLWLATARAGALLALAGVAALAHRLAGRVAAVVAPLLMALSEWWLFHAALGNSEGLLAASATWAVVAHLAGRERAALGLGVVASLLRPEAWPFVGLYGLWLWRTGRAPFGLVAAAGAAIVVGWAGPDAFGAGGLLGASKAALGFSAPTSAGSQDVPALAAIVDFAELVAAPGLLAAAVAVAAGGRTVRVLAGGALAWVLIVAVMAQAGYPGNPRYSVPAAAVAYALAGTGAVVAARRWAAGRGGERRAAPALAVLLVGAAAALAAGDLRDTVEELGVRADRRAELWTVVERAGGPRAIRACGQPRTVQYMRALVAWRTDVRMVGVSASVRPPAAVFQAPPQYGAPVPRRGAPGLEPEIPPGGPFTLRASAGGWVLQTACR